MSNKKDFWYLGDHLLICGDALDEKTVSRLVKEYKVSLILTDPPYGVDYVESKASLQGKGKKKDIANDHYQSSGEYSAFTQSWLNTVKPYLKKKNSVYIFNSDKMLFALKDGMDKADVRFTQLLIWMKSQAVVGRMDYLPQHELIVYGWYGTHAFHKSKDKSVLFYPKPRHNILHPTMKPVGLLNRLILNSSKIGDYVYDPFGGSGSTLIACEQTKRKCLMIEMDREYCLTIVKRYKDFIRSNGIKSNDKETKQHN